MRIRCRLLPTICLQRANLFFDVTPDFLPPTWFRRTDETSDEAFYAQPRFVTHIDDGAIVAVTQRYGEFFLAGGTILDLISSWVATCRPRYSIAVWLAWA